MQCGDHDHVHAHAHAHANPHYFGLLLRTKIQTEYTRCDQVNKGSKGICAVGLDADADTAADE